MTTLTLTGDLPAQLPTREDGTQYPFALAFDDRVILAETRTELTAEVIEGYADIEDGEEGDGEALWARYNAAVHFATTLQQVLAANAVEEGTFDPSQESEDTLTALFTPRSEKIDEISEWRGTVPLVLVASSYAPYTGSTRPAGNVKWIDPYTETTFLNGLHELGIAELYAQQD